MILNMMMARVVLLAISGFQSVGMGWWYWSLYPSCYTSPKESHSLFHMLADEDGQVSYTKFMEGALA